LFEPALKKAKELDSEFEKTGELCGPLHGVPLTFKVTISFFSPMLNLVNVIL
jgi:Asp-tRNA(Asn)/Glu-tRNA(Gln) amidotransferase A subunit family amidase